ERPGIATPVEHPRFVRACIEKEQQVFLSRLPVKARATTIITLVYFEDRTDVPAKLLLRFQSVLMRNRTFGVAFFTDGFDPRKRSFHHNLARKILRANQPWLRNLAHTFGRRRTKQEQNCQNWKVLHCSSLSLLTARPHSNAFPPSIRMYCPIYRDTLLLI